MRVLNALEFFVPFYSWGYYCQFHGMDISIYESYLSAFVWQLIYLLSDVRVWFPWSYLDLLLQVMGMWTIEGVLLVGCIPCAALSNSSMSICETRLFVGARTALNGHMLNSLNLNVVYAINGMFLKLLIAHSCYLRSFFLLIFCFCL